ncbi:MAG: hypothetical protein WCJ62_10915, partial [Flavobacterium sp.]
MNTEKIEKLKKGLTNSQIPESLREKIREQIKRLEAEDNASKPAPKEEASTPKMAKAPTVRKPIAKKVVEPKKETVSKTTAMSVAKEIRKDGESWNEAVKRAGTQMKKGTAEVKKSTKTEMQKLLALVKRRKDLKGLSGQTNIPRDAVRKAMPSGKRTSATGKVYYENRANRTDKGKIGNYYLENGGGVDEKSTFKYYKVPNEQLWAIQECDSDGEHCMVIRNKKSEKEAIEEVAKLNKKGYSDYELGGTVVTDLAGNTGGGDMGLNANMPLNGFSGTHYTGLVGETGAMSSGEMFELGGGLPFGAEQSYVNYYLGEGASQGIYKDGGSIPNNYEGRSAKDVWNNLTISQKKHFLSDHSSVIKYVKRNYKGIKDYNLITDEIKHQNNDWDNLDSDIKLIFKEHVEEGQYANGGGLGKAHYISNRDISGLTTKTGQRLKGSDLLDGAYTNKDIKTPKMSRTQFEDESYEYEFGGRTYQKGQPLINDRKHINSSEKHELDYAGKYPNPKRGHYNKMKVARTQFEDDTYEFEGGGSIEDANFSKFINAQINHIISLKSVAQKKEPIRNLISNMDDYKGSDMLKRITTDNLKYAL